MSDAKSKKPDETDDRGPGAKKVELEKRLDRNAEVEERAKKADEKEGKTNPVDR